MHGGFAAVAYPTRRLFEFPLGWLATGPTERLLGAVLASISDSDCGSRGELRNRTLWYPQRSLFRNRLPRISDMGRSHPGIPLVRPSSVTSFSSCEDVRFRTSRRGLTPQVAPPPSERHRAPVPDPQSVSTLCVIGRCPSLGPEVTRTMDGSCVLKGAAVSARSASAARTAVPASQTP